MLDLIPQSGMLQICSFLGVRELGRLGCVSRRFAEKSIAAPSGGGVAAVAAPVEMLSLAEEEARRWVAGCSEQERGWVPRLGLERWLCVMHELEMLRVSLVFGRAHASIMLSENGAVATRTGCGGGDSLAPASRVVMRLGRHFAQFTVVEGLMHFGVIRPGWDVEGVAGAENVDGHCFYDTGYGCRFPGAIN
jgi:hypothetical protein